MTVQDLITDTLVTMGELRPGQSPSPDDLQYGFSQLNALLDSWSTERLSLFTVESAEYQLSAGIQDYTLGPTGDFVQERPALIQTVVILLTP